MTTHSQRALILYRRRCFINHLLTYLQVDATENRTSAILKHDLCTAVHQNEDIFELILSF